MNRFAPMTCIAFLLSSSASFADVTAADVWEGLESRLDGLGGFSATTEATSNGLRVSELRFGTNEEISLTLDGAIELQENSDGTVNIVLPPELRGEVSLDTGETTEVTLSQSDMSLVASGTPLAIQYALDASKLAFKGSYTSTNDDTGSYVIEAENVSGTSFVNKGETIELDHSYDIKKIRVDAAGTSAPDVHTEAKSEGDDIAIRIAGNVPDMDSDWPLQAYMNPDVDLTISIDQGYSVVDTATTVSGNTTRTQMTTSKANTQIRLADNAASITGLAQEMAGPVVIDGWPLPEINLEIGAFETAIKVPLSKADDQSDASYKFGISGLSVNDELWDLFDANATIPRDPANLNIDISGTGNFALDQVSRSKSTDELLADDVFDTVTLEDFSLDLAGAALNAVGKFAFDYTDKTPDEAPKTDGQLDVSLTGAFTLLDNLVAIGLLQEQQTAGFKLMSNLFATPGSTSDSLESRLEVKPDGSIFANGQQIK
ncbi:MAG: hypothetical protein ABJ327_23930 [Litoreibacter sp.]